MLNKLKKVLVLIFTFSLIFANQGVLTLANAENADIDIVIDYSDDMEKLHEGEVDNSSNISDVSNIEDNNDNEFVDLDNSNTDESNDSIVFGSSNTHILDYNWFKKLNIGAIEKSRIHTINIIKDDSMQTGTAVNIDDKGLKVYLNSDKTMATIAFPENDILKLGNSIKDGDDICGAFFLMDGVSNITGLDLLDTSETTDMTNLFLYCQSLKEIDLTSWDTSKVTTMKCMFAYCQSLQELDLTNFNTQNVKSFENMFRQCTKIKSLDLSNFDTSNVTNMEGMFVDCYKLASLDISNFNTEKVTDMSNMFNSCEILPSVDLLTKNFNTKNVIDMGGMFNDCKTMVSFDLSHFDTSNVEDMNSMFSGCTNLKSIDLSNFNTSKVGLGKEGNGFFNMFRACKSLENINISSFDTKNVQYMTSMFNSCYSLEVLDLSSFEIKSLIDATWMFYDCRKLKTIYATNKFNIANNPDGDDMFHKATCLVGGNGTTYSSDKVSRLYARVDEPGKPGYFTIKPKESVEPTSHILDYNWIIKTKMEPIRDNYDIYSKYTQIEFKKGSDIPAGTKIALDDKGLYAYMDEANGKITIMIPQGDTLKLGNAIKNERNNSKGAFSDLKVIKSISGLDLIDTSETTDMSCLFSECRQIESLDVTSFNTTNVKSMYGMFYATIKLKGIDLSNFDTSNVENFSSMFYWSGLEELNVTNFNTSKATDVNSMFHGAGKLKKLDLSSFDTSNVVDFGGMFRECESITTLDLSNFDTKNAKYMNGMFDTCSSLISIDLSSFDTSNVLKMGNMFSNCSKLKSLDLSNFNTSKVGYGYTEEVGDFFAMFHNCKSLTKLDLSSFDTRNVKCMGHMFNICSGLVELDLSSFDTQSVLDASEMFGRCTNLKTIYATNKFHVTRQTDGDGMFWKAYSLVGQNGTTFSEDKDSMLYGRVDEPGKPGYFTIKKEKPVEPTSEEQPTSKEEQTTKEEPTTKEEETTKEQTTSTEESTTKEKETKATESSATEVIAPSEDTHSGSTTGSSTSGTSGTSGNSGSSSDNDSSSSSTQQSNALNEAITSNANKVTKQENVTVNTSLYGTVAAMSKEALNGVNITREGDKTVFRDKQGNLLKGMQKIKINNQDGLYFFKSDNTLAMGFMKDENNNVHYFDGNGQMVMNRTITVGLVTYEINENGEINQSKLDKQTKDLLLNSCETNIYSGENLYNESTNTWSTLIVNPHTGQKELAKGLVQLVQADGINTYYFDAFGKLVTGDVFVNGKILHFDPNGGKLVENNSFLMK